MSLRLVYRPEAEREIMAAAAWYEERGHRLATEFLRAWEAAVTAVTHAPERNPEVAPHMRRILLQRFPYSLIYSVHHGDLVILACTHWRQDSRRWQRR